MDLPWLEKHRPKNLNDIVGNTAAIERLKTIAQTGNLTNLLFAGPAGTGKTSSILSLARALLGNSFKRAVLELNASDERGIDTVRNKVKTFAQTQVSLPPGRHKLIILDEADSITPSAQNALRRTMELYSASTRFILSCNISDKIMEPIQSRCAILRFSRLTDQDVLKRVMQVLELEKINTYTTDGLEAITFLADGDLRNAINTAQATIAGFGSITGDNVYKIGDVPHPFILKDILTLCKTSEISPALDKLNALLRKGYLASDVVSSLFRVVKSMGDLDDALRLEFIKCIGFSQMAVLEGSDTNLQINGLIASLCRTASEAAH